MVNSTRTIRERLRRLALFVVSSVRWVCTVEKSRGTSAGRWWACVRRRAAFERWRASSGRREVRPEDFAACVVRLWGRRERVRISCGRLAAAVAGGGRGGGRRNSTWKVESWIWLEYCGW